MKVVFDENFFDEIDHFHPNFDPYLTRDNMGNWEHVHVTVED